MIQTPKLRVTARFASIVLALGAGSFGAAFAQETQPAAVQPPAPLSNDEQLNQAQSIVQSGNDLSQRVGHMLDEAGREGDIIRVTCLNDKLTQINANLRSAQSRLTVLQGTVDSGERSHEYTVLTVLGQKFQTLDQEANQCIGQDLYETGSTKVVTEIDTSILPAGDANSLPVTTLAPGNVNVTPGAATPTGSEE